jgi:tetratricopeptide (TPR) repeat protein
MPRRTLSTAKKNRLREEALRPCSILGYEYDSVAVHLISRESYRIAESLLRRCVWLNPFEPRFKEHLACCLSQQKKFAEAKELAQTLLKQNPGNRAAREILLLCGARKGDKVSGGGDAGHSAPSS